MAKGLPKASDGATPGSQSVSAPRTPTGVWVIVGMAIFFVIGGLGISGLIIWKAIGEKKPVAGAAVTEVAVVALVVEVELLEALVAGQAELEAASARACPAHAR